MRRAASTLLPRLSTNPSSFTGGWKNLMHLPELPDQIQSEDVQRALESLGIPSARLVETVFHPNSVAVTYLRTNADDEPLAGSSDSISRVTTSIRVRWPKRAT